MSQANQRSPSWWIRLFTKPFFVAVYAWILVGAALYVLMDFLVMPFIAGKFKETVPVPELIGLSPEEADNKLVSGGLQYMLDSVGDYSAEIAAGKVLSQYPKASTVVKEGRRVWVKISKGPRSQLLPPLRGLSLRQAEITLQQLGLKLGRVRHVRHHAVPSGAVAGSEPEAGAAIEKGRTVDILVSSGLSQNARTMPNLVGLSLGQAREKLRENGLELGKIAYRRENRKPPETVLAHTPKPGQILSGQPVNFVVSQ